jgi:hypothetical protein
MIDSTTLTADLQVQVRTLEDDLRVRADEVDEVRALVIAEWKTAADAGRTARDLETWREGLLTQVAVARLFSGRCLARLRGHFDQRYAPPPHRSGTGWSIGIRGQGGVRSSDPVGHSSVGPPVTAWCRRRAGGGRR